MKKKNKEIEIDALKLKETVQKNLLPKMDAILSHRNGKPEIKDKKLSAWVDAVVSKKRHAG